MKPLLQTGTDMLADPAKDSIPKVRWGSGLHGVQRGYQQDNASNEGACVLDLPGDLADDGQTNVATA